MTRKTIYLDTYLRVKEFLQKQESPVSKREISDSLKLDFYSLNVALEHLDIKKTEKGKIYFEQ